MQHDHILTSTFFSVKINPQSRTPTSECLTHPDRIAPTKSMATGICWQYMGYFETQQLVILYNNIYIHIYIYISVKVIINIYICILWLYSAVWLLFARFPVPCQLYSYVQLVGLCLTGSGQQQAFPGFSGRPAWRQKGSLDRPQRAAPASSTPQRK